MQAKAHGENYINVRPIVTFHFKHCFRPLKNKHFKPFQLKVPSAGYAVFYV